MAERNLLEVADAEGWPPSPVPADRKALERAGRAPPAAVGSAFRRRGIGSCDRLHFLPAPCLGAQAICAAYRAFADVCGSDDEFGHMWIQPASGPLGGPLAGRSLGGAGAGRTAP